ncbi:uncharacterized protein MYCFIDRAFT_169264 [Pseudocercospora fijiensis CIRAD86]|uniref:Uncharacterized protein n=1 Tax=Pseudocercospora fijiensis (strain CIRAD86) TaxID=383855 RepID=N1Q5X2_PSEFD|nr:uncharacterized protein MYCFIDRAFT_169264 [Pseudocercospora fijiensis CIRAD86]EME87444.1 hypothetical protein MYCFIDRAFT_169264 [Pseudocercospora fijiensis CIRAD86]
MVHLEIVPVRHWLCTFGRQCSTPDIRPETDSLSCLSSPWLTVIAIREHLSVLQLTAVEYPLSHERVPVVSNDCGRGCATTMASWQRALCNHFCTFPCVRLRTSPLAPGSTGARLLGPYKVPYHPYSGSGARTLVWDFIRLPTLFDKPAIGPYVQVSAGDSDNSDLTVLPSAKPDVLLMAQFAGLTESRSTTLLLSGQLLNAGHCDAFETGTAPTDYFLPVPAALQQVMASVDKASFLQLQSRDPQPSTTTSAPSYQVSAWYLNRSSSLTKAMSRRLHLPHTNLTPATLDLSIASSTYPKVYLVLEATEPLPSPTMQELRLRLHIYAFIMNSFSKHASHDHQPPESTDIRGFVSHTSPRGRGDSNHT